MSHKLFPTPPTPAQAAQILRSELGSSRYHIFDLSKRWSTTTHDFVAVHKDNVNNFIVVRARRLPVQGLPFGLIANTIPGSLVFKRLCYDNKPIARIGPQIDLRRMNLKLEHFIPPRDHAQFEQLFPGLKLAA